MRQRVMSPEGSLAHWAVSFRCLGAPGGVGVQLREGVLLLLVRGGRRECRRLLPLVLQHQTLRRTLGVHRDSAALAYLGGLLGGRLEAAEGGCGNHGGEPGLRPAYHPPSCSPSPLCVCASATIHCSLDSHGQGGIRTHGTLAGTPVFETGRFNRSRTCPLTAGEQITVTDAQTQQW